MSLRELVERVERLIELMESLIERLEDDAPSTPTTIVLHAGTPTND